MPVDIREQLVAAAGQTAAPPDVAAAMRRGARLRRRRRLAVSAGTVTAIALVVATAAVVLGPAPQTQVPAVGDRPATGSVQQLDAFERPATTADRIGSMGYASGTRDDPGVQRRSPRLDAPFPQVGNEGLADSDTYPLDVDHEAARLAWRQDDLTVHLAPPTDTPVDPDLQLLDGEWLYAVLEGRGGTSFTGSAPVPAPGTASWAGSVPIRGTLTAILVVGDGLTQAQGPSTTAAVQDNVVLVEDVGRGDQVTLDGPAGSFTLSVG